MDAEEIKVDQVLDGNERFVVPLYQRQYQWHDDWDGARTNGFWQDVAAKAADVLDGRARFEHYMGALLLAPGVKRRRFGRTPVSQVVDGQQRLTTFLILLAAIREIAKKHSFDDIVEECQKYIFNKPGRADTDAFVRYRLTPTPVDRQLFFNILNLSLAEVRQQYRKRRAYWGSGVPKNTPFRALRAYEFFVAQVTNFLDYGPSEDQEIRAEPELSGRQSDEGHDENMLAHDRLNALLEALVFHLKLIVITLDERDDAQVIFETLNSAGQPLLAMDLVRNNIFHRAETQFHEQTGQEQVNNVPSARDLAERLYQDVWAPFDDPWWREPAPFARPHKPRIDHFLANVLTVETGERITVRELYAEYRAWATPNRRPRFEAVEDELAVLQKHSPTYKVLEGKRDGDPTITWLGSRLRLWQYTTAYPIAFQIAGEMVEDHTSRTIALLIDSYLTRRALCGLTPKNLNRLFPRLTNSFRQDGVSIDTVRRFFKKQDRPTTRFPDDTELCSAILEEPAYGNIPARILSDILWSLEIASRGPKTEATARPPLWLEHVMPVSWQHHWPILDEAGKPVGSDDMRCWKRESAIHTLGNLTIVTDLLNMSLKNLPFDKKQPQLYEHSNLTLNRKIAQRDDWDESVIRDRGKKLATLACDIWPTPESVI